MTHLRIEIDGLPQPGGSKRVVTLPPIMKKVGRFLGGELWIPASKVMNVVRVLDDNPKAAAWKKLVAESAIKQLGIHADSDQRLLMAEELIMTTQFFMPRPKGHFKKDGSLSALGKRTPRPLVKPDALKLMRSTEDALTGVVYADDALITDHFIHKRYADNPGQVGAIIHIFPAAQYQYEITFRKGGLA